MSTSPNCEIVSQGGRLAPAEALGRKGNTSVLVSYRTKLGEPRQRWLPKDRVRFYGGEGAFEMLPKWKQVKVCPGIVYRLEYGWQAEAVVNHAERTVVLPDTRTAPTGLNERKQWGSQIYFSVASEIRSHLGFRCRLCGFHHRQRSQRVRLQLPEGGTLPVRVPLGDRPITKMEQVPS